MAAKNAIPESTATGANRSLNITRTFDARRERVWQAFTDPAILQRWWGPKGFTNPVCEADVRPGGALRIHMRGPDGTVHPMVGKYDEVVPPERLRFTSSALGPDGTALFEVVTTVVLEDLGGKTKITVDTNVFGATAAAAPALAGMEKGWNQTLDRLDDEVTSRS